MSIFNFGRKKNFRNDNIIDILTRIKRGDNSERETFIDENKSNILKVVSQTLGKSTVPRNSIEFEIGLSAFNYAIDNFDLNVKNIFLTYAEQVIKEWIIDYLRSKQSNEASSNFISDEKNYLYYSVEDKDELSQFKIRLWEFGIILQDLVMESPSGDNSVRSALKISRILTENDTLYNKLVTKKDIPYEDLDDYIRSLKKDIEKYKKYILVLCLIIKSDLKILNSYLKNIETGKGLSENIGLVLEIYKNQAIIFTFQGNFTVVKIKNFNDLVVGKQINLENYNTKHISSGKKAPKYFLFAGSALIILSVSLIIAYYFSDSNSKTTVIENHTQSTYVSPTIPVNTDLPTSTTSNEGIESVATSEIIIETPEPAPTDKTTESVVNTPKKNTPRKTPTRRPTPVPTPKKNNPNPSSKIRQATGIPGVPDISSDFYVVRVGEKYTVSMNMHEGNNATSLILYENDEVIAVKHLEDNTPQAQKSSVSIVAKYEGMYKYRWELINEFGTIRSSSIWISIISK
jgi:RNA polymerase sigma-I factor